MALAGTSSGQAVPRCQYRSDATPCSCALWSRYSQSTSPPSSALTRVAVSAVLGVRAQHRRSRSSGRLTCTEANTLRAPDQIGLYQLRYAGKLPEGLRPPQATYGHRVDEIHAFAKMRSASYIHSNVGVTCQFRQSLLGSEGQDFRSISFV